MDLTIQNPGDEDYIILYRETKRINGVDIEGTIVCIAEPSDNVSSFTVQGHAPYYYAKYLDVDIARNCILVTNNDNKTITSFDGTYGWNYDSGYFVYNVWFPDSVIDFRPYISQINS